MKNVQMKATATWRKKLSARYLYLQLGGNFGAAQIQGSAVCAHHANFTVLSGGGRNGGRELARVQIGVVVEEAKRREYALLQKLLFPRA